MAHVTILLPGMLAMVVEGRTRLEVEAATLPGVFEEIVRGYPALAQRIFDESGRLRQHVLCFLNETNTRWLADPAAPVKAGDVVSFLQAVSGG